MTNTTSVQYPVVVYPDICTDGAFCYVAEHPDLPGCAAHGDTIQEAKSRLAQAKEAYLRQMHSEGKPFPQPNLMRPSSIEWESGDLQDGADEQQIAAA